MLYRVKCLNRCKEHGLSKYYIHYINWNSRYNEWITENRLYDPNEENLKILEEMELKEKEKKAEKKKIMAAM